MLSSVSVLQSTIQSPSSYPPDVAEVLFSMCQIAQPHPPQPVVRWILEEGQLLGVLVASV